MRALARRLLGDRVGAWRLTGARASSGVRVTFERPGAPRPLVVVVRPAGAPGFVATPRLSAMLVGRPKDADEQAFVEAARAALERASASWPPGELEDALAAAARRLAPVAASEVEARPLRPGHAELRLNLACNQRCFFCNCDGFAPNLVPAHDQALAEVARLPARGVERLTLTGGEPTLHHALPELARAAKQAGLRHVSVQTNAINLAAPGAAAALRDAGVDELFVSLHSARAAVSDRITGEPGTHALTLAGIDAALAAGLGVVTNFVITRLNLTEPPVYVGWLRARFPRLRGRVFSFMAPVGAALKNLALLPRLAEAAPPLRAALDDCRRHRENVRVAGVCGLPLCQLAGYEELCDEHDNPAGVALAEDRDKPASCAPCRHHARCSGVWRRYLELHGAGELVPVVS